MMADNTTEYTYVLRVDETSGQIKLGKFQKELDKTGEEAAKTGKKVKSAFDQTSASLKGLSTDFIGVGKALSLGFTIPLAAIGALAMSAAGEMKKGYNIIRAETGATGEKFQALKADMKAVFTSTDSSAQQAATAVGELSTRLGLAGEPLQNLSKQIIALSELTGEDLKTTIASSTRVFGDWSVATSKQAETLDFLFKVSQNTGIGVNRLMQLVVQFGAPLRAMGFTIQESATMLGKWEKEGVNTELVLGSLRIAMAKFASDGIPMRKGLEDTIKKIQQLGPGAQATSEAMKIFGRRAGPDMAAAILEGRFGIEQLQKQIEGSTDTILKAKDETEGFGAKMKELRNNIVAALEPLGKDLVRMMKTDFIPLIKSGADTLKGLLDWFVALPGPVKTGIEYLGLFLSLLGPMALGIGGIIGTGAKIVGYFGSLSTWLIKVTGEATAGEAALAALGNTAKFLGAGLAVAGAAFVGWEIGRFISQIEICGVSLDSLTQKLYTWLFYSRQNENTSKEMIESTKKLGAALKTPIFQQAGESFASFSMAVQKAAAAESFAEIRAAQLAAEQAKLNQHLTNTGNAGKLTEEQIKKYGESLGVTIPKLREAIKEGQAYIQHLKSIKAPTYELIEAQNKLKEAQGKLNYEMTLAKFPFIKYLEDFIKGTENSWKECVTLGKEMTVTQIVTMRLGDSLQKLGLMSPIVFDSLVDGAKRYTDALKTLQVKSDKDLLNSVEKARSAYKAILDNANASAREKALSWAKWQEAELEYTRANGGKINQEISAKIDQIKEKYGEMGAAAEDQAKKVREAWSNQISTIVTDFSKGVVDIVFEGKKLGDTLIGIFKEFGKSALRMLVEQFFAPLMKYMSGIGAGLGSMLSGKNFNTGFSGIMGQGSTPGSGLMNTLGGLFGLGKKGSSLPTGMTAAYGTAGGNVANIGLLPGLGNIPSWAGGPEWGGGVTTPGTLGMGANTAGTNWWGKGGAGYNLVGAGLGIGGGILLNAGSKTNNPYMNVGGGAMSGAGMGMAIGSMILPGLGTAIGAAIGAAGGAIFGGIKTILQRGAAKKEATALVEETSKQIWDIVEQVKSGKIAASEAKTGIDQMWTAYVQALNANVKDKTVIQRSIDSQIFMVQQAKDAVDKVTKEQKALTEAQGVIAKYMAAMLASGKMTIDFADYIVKAGGKIEDFEKVLKIKPMQDFQSAIQKLSQSITPTSNTFEKMVDVLINTGEVTDELAAKFEEFGVSTEALYKYADALKKLREFQGVFGEMRNQLIQLQPKQEDMISQFLQLGIITPELTRAIYKAGLSMGDFRKYARIAETNADFQSLIQNFTWTESGIESLRPSFIALGGDIAALDAAKQVPALMGLLGTFNEMSTTLDGLLPKTKSLSELFFETGQVSPDLAKAIKDAGGNIGVFEDFGKISNVKKQWDPLFEAFEKAGSWMKLDSADQQQLVDLMRSLNDPNISLQIDSGQFDLAVQNAATVIGTQYTNLATNLQTELDKMKTGIQDQIALLQKGLEDAIGFLNQKLQDQLAVLGAGLVEAITGKEDGLVGAVDDASAGLNLILSTLDTNLTTAIGELQTGVTTAVNDLAHAIAGVDTPKTTQPSYNPNPYSPATSGRFGPKPANYPSYLPWPPGTGYQYGTDYVPETGYKLIHEGEKVIPKWENRRESAPATSNVFSPTIIFENVTDPIQQRREIEKVFRELARKLR